MPTDVVTGSLSGSTTHVPHAAPERTQLSDVEDKGTPNTVPVIVAKVQQSMQRSGRLAIKLEAETAAPAMTATVKTIAKGLNCIYERKKNERYPSSNINNGKKLPEVRLSENYWFSGHCYGLSTFADVFYTPSGRPHKASVHKYELTRWPRLLYMAR